MPPKKATSREVPSVDEVLAWLQRTGTKKTRDGMARYGIPSDGAFGVPVGALRKYAKGIGMNHALAEALWDTGRYEARMLTAFLAEPARVTPAEMDRWCRDFDSWAICDTLCFHLFDRTPHAWSKVPRWAKKREEFQKRAAFALLASLAGHDRDATDETFLRSLPLIEAAATDERNFVKKAVSWALRSVGRRSVAVNEAAVALAQKLAGSEDPTARWIGRGAAKELTSAAVQRRLAEKIRRKRSA